MEFQLSDKVVEHLKEKKVEHLAIMVKLHEEPCTQIYNPVVKHVTDGELESLEKVGEKHKLNFYIHPDFKKHFGNPKEISLALKGLFKKKLEITNIDPKITNVCKI